jgi:hypothetical protein
MSLGLEIWIEKTPFTIVNNNNKTKQENKMESPRRNSILHVEQCQIAHFFGNTYICDKIL